MADKKAPTQDEIIQEVGQVSTSKRDPNDRPAVQDPIVWRQDYKTEDIINGRDPKLIKNGSMNKDAYGDDGNGVNNVDIPDMYGGKNNKYIGEGTRGTFEGYNPNIKTTDLDPNYQYGVNARMANSAEANYIARRNDNIASALYNEGKRSMQDVADFLNAQEGFRNSTEGERRNTITSVWKRIGDLGQQNQNNNAGGPNTNNSPEDNPNDAQNNEGLNKMEEDLNKSTAGELYGKVTADEKTAIKTLEDENSVYKAMNDSRIQSFKNLQAMDSQAIAAAVISGAIASDSQQMRDLMQYDPAKYQYVQQAIKQIRGQNTINSITSGDYNATSEIDSKQKGLESEKTSMAESVSNSEQDTVDILRSIDSDLASNTAATTAEQTMASITADINKLNTRLKNLDKEASAIFKGDVPDYIVKAYKANRTAEIQDKLKELQYNYDAAYSRYQNELNNTWKEKEYQISLRNIRLQEDKFEYEKQKANIKNNEVVWKDGEAYQIKYTENGVTISKAAIMQQYTDSGMKGAGLKNNNPGNIKDTQFGNVIGTGDNGFAQFATPEDGFDALVEKIKFNQTNPSSRYYGKTIREYFQLYAPSSDGNNPDAYARSVAKQLGVSIDTPISQLDPIKFAAEIAKHDSGYDYSTYGKFRGGSTGGQSNFDESSIEIPDDIYIVDDGYQTKKVDPNSAEGQKLREDYINMKKQELGVSNELIADADGRLTAAYQVISSDGTTPIAFRQRIYNLVPATLKNSDTELKNLYAIAKDLYVTGYSPDEAAMVFYGLDPRNDKTGLLKPLIYTARTSGKKLDESFYGNLGSLLDSGNTKQAIRLVENNVLSEDEKKQEATAMSVIRKIQDLENKLDGAEEAVGPFEGTVADWTNKYIKGGGENAQIAADIANIYSQIRKELLGSNITETELSANKGLFPSTSDKMANIKVKLNATKSSLLNDVNATRSLYDLPQLDEYTLVDLGARSYLYGGIDTSSMDISSNTNWG